MRSSPLLLCAAVAVCLVALVCCLVEVEGRSSSHHRAPVAAVRHHRPRRSECKLPNGFVHLSDAAPSIIQTMRYAGHHNFVGRPVANYTAPECILTESAAWGLAKVQDYLLSGKADPTGAGQTYSLKTYDCYRPTSAVADFVSWAKVISDTLMKAEFYPEEEKSALFDDGYIAYHSGHSHGSTMDLTIVPLPAAEEPVYHPGQALVNCHAEHSERWPDNSLDMGTGFDCFSKRAWTNDTVVTKEAQRNRQMLVDAMRMAEFTNYDEEWWHFTLDNEPFPDVAFDFPVC